jgi:hypothetical protein
MPLFPPLAMLQEPLPLPLPRPPPLPPRPLSPPLPPWSPLCPPRPPLYPLFCCPCCCSLTKSIISSGTLKYLICPNHQLQTCASLCSRSNIHYSLSHRLPVICKTYLRPAVKDQSKPLYSAQTRFPGKFDLLFIPDSFVLPPSM